MNHLGDTNKMVGEDHIRDATKMVSDTPRTDAHIDGLRRDPEVSGCDRTLNFCRQLERELNAANQRIKRLEDYGNALVAHVYAYRTQRQWTEESYHDLIQTIADWDKAKATKP